MPHTMILIRGSQHVYRWPARNYPDPLEPGRTFGIDTPGIDQEQQMTDNRTGRLALLLLVPGCQFRQE